MACRLNRTMGGEGRAGEEERGPKEKGSKRTKREPRAKNLHGQKGRLYGQEEQGKRNPRARKV